MTKISKLNGSVVSTYSVGSNPEGIAYDSHHIWVTNRGDGTVTELTDPGGSVVATYPTGAGAGGQPIGIAYDGKYMWIANSAASSGRSLRHVGRSHRQSPGLLHSLVRCVGWFACLGGRLGRRYGLQALGA